MKFGSIVIMMMAMLLIPAASATFRWQYENAEGQVCYNINGSASQTGLLDSSWYSVAFLNITLNQSFWSDTLRSYHPASDTNLSQFSFAQNATNVFVLVPIADSFSGGVAQAYCTYAGDENLSDIRNVSPYNLGFDGSLSSLTAENNSAYTAVQNPDGTWNVSAANAVGFKDLTTPSTKETLIEMWVKAKKISSNTTSGSNSAIGIFSGNSTLNSSGVGIGVFEDNMSHGWFSVDSAIGGAVDNEWHIYRSSGATNSGAATDDGYVFNESMSRQGTTSINYPSTFGFLNRIYPLYIRNASATFDWGLAFRADTGATPLFASNVTYDFINPNISILSPEWESVISSEDAAVMSVQYLQAFDNCTISIEGTDVLFYSGISSGQITTDIINNSQITTGENEIIVSCRDSSNAETHRYWYFSKEGVLASDLFMQAFNIDLNNQGCPANILTALDDACIEAYNLTQIYPFGAVVCYNLNVTGRDYSCINEFDNRTKNNYTLFWSPSSWDYDSDEAIQHIGATFYTSGSKINGRIELYNPTKFMYIPAQTKPRDCEIYYSSSTTGCSWWEGFVVNNASVIISDKNNNWFQSGGTGIEDFNINFSQSVINVNVISILNQTPGFFPDGIFLRKSCRLQNGSWNIDMVNTLAQTYTLTIIGNTSLPSFTVVAASLSQEINVTNISSITLSNQNGTLCTYNSGDTIFLPFSMPELAIDGYYIILWAGLLFSVVLSAITPFALFIPFILNDTYQLLDPYQIGLIGVFCIVAGFANNAFSMQRSLKHLILVVCIVIGYLVTLGDYSQSALGINLIGYSSSVESLTGLMTTNSPGEFAFGLVTFIVNFGIFIIFLPANFIFLMMQLLPLVSPVLASQVGIFAPYLAIGFMAYFYLKLYEILSKQFPGVV
jgi:hypothetical protein